jgi:hypothetical protein
VTILFIFFVVTAALGCHKETEQDRIKKVITDIQTAAEEKDVKEIMSHLAETYSDPQGFNYKTIRTLLLVYFMKNPKISAYINGLKISVENTSARVAFQAVLTSGSKTGSVADVIPQSLGMYNFNVSLRKESNVWKIASVTWMEVEITKTWETDSS